MLSTHRRRARWLGLLAMFLVALLGIAPSAATAATATGYTLVPGWVILPGTITGPGLDHPRVLNSKQAAAFIQSWYGATIYGTIPVVKKPTGVDIFTVTITDLINSTPQKFIAFYAEQGAKILVGMPPQTIGGGAFVPEEKWFQAPPRAKLAFEGKVDPIPTELPTTTTIPSTTTTVHATGTSSGKSKSSSTGPVVAAIAGGVIVIGGGLLFMRRRKQTPANPSH